MKKGERLYRITKAQVERFERALKELTDNPRPEPSVHPRLMQAQEEALRSQLADLQAELAEHDASGRQDEVRHC